jgi:hypothetical protein
LEQSVQLYQPTLAQPAESSISTGLVGWARASSDLASLGPSRLETVPLVGAGIGGRGVWMVRWC